MRFSRNTILVNLRFLDAALSRLEPTEQAFLHFGTDGKHLFYEPEYLLKRYAKNSYLIVHDYLHTLLHCIFRHNFIDPYIERDLWDIACDIAVENVMIDLGMHSAETENNNERFTEIVSLRDDIPLLTAEKIYSSFKNTPPNSNRLKVLSSLFCCDDHCVWYMTEAQKSSAGLSGESEDDNSGNNSGGNSEDISGSGDTASAKDNDSSPEPGSCEDWKNIAEHIQVDMETISQMQGDKTGALLQELMAVNREKYDYTAFLKKFAVMGEAMKVNDDEFDYIFYTYGLTLYKNMPLIEPLEYKEVKRIREFVVAIDTSGSVEGELVQSFLQKTYNIMKQSESFFSKINVHIIQCDADIQEHVKITSQDEFDDYIKNMKILGLGGTDFRPVFELVDKLISEKEFANLKGLIYFTDGYGEFPSKKPNYETAFVFIKEDYESPDVPPWAIKLILEKEDII